MNPNGDPVGERLRSYYQSIQGDAPLRLEARRSIGPRLLAAEAVGVAR